ncbi:MAG TPA: hypothetical protein PLD79_00635 [Halothiobacillus sp.]|nr:MAG: hypothetical protein B7Z82_04590 [Halothiobacillus sp. 20-54-6]HQT42466.1 hypothetical protein [Halothiobacillus sp.]
MPAFSHDVLSRVLLDRLALLQRLGDEVDAEAARWLLDQTGASDRAALSSIAEARRVIELTVDLALSQGYANHPDVVAMRAVWEQRFSRMSAAIQKKHTVLSQSAQMHTKQTRAAQAYIGTEGLSG